MSTSLMEEAILNGDISNEHLQKWVDSIMTDEFMEEQMRNSECMQEFLEYAKNNNIGESGLHIFSMGVRIGTEIGMKVGTTMAVDLLNGKVV